MVTLLQDASSIAGWHARYVAVLVFSLSLAPGCGEPVGGTAAMMDAASARSEALANTHQAALGVGVDFAETKTYGQCVTVPTVDNRRGMASSLYNETAIRDRSELNSVLDIQASLSAKGFWGSASGSASYFKNVNMSSESFYWLVYADYRLRDKNIDLSRIELTKAAKEILSGPRGLGGFYEACGEYFYSGSQQGATYALLYEFKSAEEKTVEKIKAAASYSGWGVQAKASFEKFSEMAIKSSVLKVHAANTGASERLRSYASNPVELEEELTKLRDDLYNHETGVETEWFISDYNMFPEVQAAKAAAIEANRPLPTVMPKLMKDSALTKMYNQHVKNVDLEQRILASLERASGDEPLVGYGPEKRKRMREVLEAIDGQRIALAERAKTCIASDQPADCATGELLPAAWDVADAEKFLHPDQDYTTLMGWSLRLLRRTPHSQFFDIEGLDPRGCAPVSFLTGHAIRPSPLGILWQSEDDPYDALVLGSSEQVRDPVSGLKRPNMCVYDYVDTCSLRMVPMAATDPDGNHLVKLQLVLFDSFGFAYKKLNFPAGN